VPDRDVLDDAYRLFIRNREIENIVGSVRRRSART